MSTYSWVDVMPTTEIEKDHVSGPDCWCEPLLWFVSRSGNQVYVHEYPDDFKPSAKKLVEALKHAMED